MNTRVTGHPHASTPGFVELYTPKLVTILREGYTLAHFRSDALAGLPVAIVALPLSMAIAIASGASPAQGHRDRRRLLGFRPRRKPVSDRRTGRRVHRAGGGDRPGAWHGRPDPGDDHERRGPAGVGFLCLGTYIKFIPYPVTVGFTAGIAVIIFASQLKELLGLTLAGPEPGPLVEKVQAPEAGITPPP